MSAVLNANAQPSTTPAMPADLALLETPHGTIRFYVAELRVHGLRVNIKTEVKGSGGGFSIAGTGTSGMTIDSKSETVREFWLSPVNGGRERKMELVDSDFGVADGHRVLGVYAQVGQNEQDLFAIVNLNDGSAMKLDGTASMPLHQKYCAQLLGKQSTMIVWLIVAVLGVTGWLWAKYGWMVAMIGGLVITQMMISRVPALRRRASDAEERAKIEKSIKDRLYLCLKWLDNTFAPRWS
jgi:hypothetical protein